MMSKKEDFVKRKKLILISRLLLIAVLSAIFFLATTRLDIPVVDNINDKVNHALAFVVLALLVDLSWPQTGLSAGKVFALLGYGLAIEIVQYFLPYRTFSLWDLAADGTGIFLYRFASSLVAAVIGRACPDSVP